MSREARTHLWPEITISLPSCRIAVWMLRASELATMEVHASVSVSE
jgi:hypothetical protein